MKPSDTALLLSSERIVNLQKEVHVDTLRLPKKHDKLPKVVIEGFLEDVVRAQPPHESKNAFSADPFCGRAWRWAMLGAFKT